MVYLNIMGRCGNQLFQYSFLKAVNSLNENKYEIIINFNGVELERQKEVDSYGDKLSKFNVKFKKAEGSIKLKDIYLKNKKYILKY